MPRCKKPRPWHVSSNKGHCRTGCMAYVQDGSHDFSESPDLQEIHQFCIVLFTQSLSSWKFMIIYYKYVSIWAMTNSQVDRPGQHHGSTRFRDLSRVETRWWLGPTIYVEAVVDDDSSFSKTPKNKNKKHRIFGSPDGCIVDWLTNGHPKRCGALIDVHIWP